MAKGLMIQSLISVGFYVQLEAERDRARAKVKALDKAIDEYTDELNEIKSDRASAFAKAEELDALLASAVEV